MSRSRTLHIAAVARAWRISFPTVPRVIAAPPYCPADYDDLSSATMRLTSADDVRFFEVAWRRQVRFRARGGSCVVTSIGRETATLTFDP